MLLGHQKGPGKLQGFGSCVGSRQELPGASEELEARGLARPQNTPGSAPLTGLAPGFMTSKLSHCLLQSAERQTLSEALTQMRSREGRARPQQDWPLDPRSGHTGGSQAALMV